MFLLDSIGSDIGFQAVVTLVESQCGQTRIDLNETSPNYEINWPGSTSKTYLPNMRCLWTVNVPIENLINLSFNKIDIQMSNITNNSSLSDMCTNDYLEVVDEKVKHSIKD